MLEPSIPTETEIILDGALQDCYNDGRRGAAGYPLNAADFIVDYTKQTGMCTDFMKQFITRFVDAMNAEYSRGRKEGST